MPKKHQPAGINMTPSITEFGSFIRARRLELDMRQVLLAKQAGLVQTFISMLEIGTRTHLNDCQLEKLAKALQCNPEELRKRIPIKHSVQPRTELGKLIRARREELGLTIKDFAKKMRTTHQKARLLETRKNPGVRFDLVKSLVNALELEPSAFAQFVGMHSKPTNSELGKLVRTRRKELTMSIRQLAKKLRVSYQFVNQIESGQCRLSQNDDMIERLAQVLKLNINELQVVRLTRRLKQMKIARTPLGGFLTARRLELCLTQREVSEHVGTVTSYISDLEAGRKIHPNPSLLNKLAKVFNCQIPPELIPSPREYNYHGNKEKERETPLGNFVMRRRLELHLSRRQVEQRAGMTYPVVWKIERGIYHAGPLTLERISRALKCKIPADLISHKES